MRGDWRPSLAPVAPHPGQLVCRACSTSPISCSERPEVKAASRRTRCASSSRVASSADGVAAPALPPEEAAAFEALAAAFWAFAITLSADVFRSLSALYEAKGACVCVHCKWTAVGERARHAEAAPHAPDALAAALALCQRVNKQGDVTGRLPDCKRRRRRRQQQS